MVRTLPWLILLVLATSCERELTPRLATQGVDREGVEVDVKLLGQLTDEQVVDRKTTVGVDGIQRLAPGTCQGGCDWAEISVYIRNTSGERMPSPVVRVDAPEGSPKRPPLGLGVGGINPGRIGRIRWLVELYPNEEHVDVRLSGSVFFEVTSPEPGPATEEPRGSDVNAEAASGASANRAGESEPPERERPGRDRPAVQAKKDDGKKNGFAKPATKNAATEL